MKDLGYVAPYLMRQDALDSALKDARTKLSELEYEQRNREKWSPEQKLSIKLHDALCQSRDCDFYYQFGKDGIQSTAGSCVEPVLYRGMAAKLMRFVEKHATSTEELIDIFRLRAVTP